MLCPVCNGIRVLNAICPVCEACLIDDGRVLDQTDPYTPYLPLNDNTGHLSASRGDECCEHSCHCGNCGLEVKFQVSTLGVNG